MYLATVTIVKGLLAPMYILYNIISVNSGILYSATALQLRHFPDFLYYLRLRKFFAGIFHIAAGSW